MRHLKRGRKFGREKKGREALLRNLAYSFFRAGRIITTEAKAKELRPFVEKLIQRAKAGDLAATKKISAIVPHSIVPKLVKEIAPNYLKRHGGYTRIIKINARKSDSAKRAILELV